MKPVSVSPRQSDKPATIMIADGNPVMLAAMSEMFDRDPRFSLVATTTTAEGFLRAVLQMPVQIGVIDWNIPALGGARLIDVLRAPPNAPRLVVYADDAGETPAKAIAAGAAGFASRAESAERLLETCLAVAKGQMMFPFLDMRSLRHDPMDQLSRRERALLEALSKGLTNRELARELGISANTVKFHLSNLFDKIGVRNRARAIAFFYAHRIGRDES